MPGELRGRWHTNTRYKMQRYQAITASIATMIEDAILVQLPLSLEHYIGGGKIVDSKVKQDGI